MVMLSCLLLFHTKCAKILGIPGAEKRHQDRLGSAHVADYGLGMSLRSSETFLEKFFGWVLG